MSQIQSFVTGEGPGPGPILSLTGDTGGPVGPDGGGNINVLGDFLPTVYQMAIVNGTPGSHTLNIAPVTDDATTIGAVNATIFSLAIPSNQAVVVRARIIAQNSAFTACAGGDIVAIGRNPGGAGAIVTSGGSGIVTDYVGNPPPTVIGTSSGNNIIIQVTGVAAQTWNWTAAIMYTFQF